MLRLIATFAGLNGLLLGVAWLHDGAPGVHWLAIEALLITGALALCPRRRWSTWLAGALGIAAAGVLLLAAGDRLTGLSLARPLNVYLDWRLAPAIYHLAAGQVGAWPAAIGIGLALLLTGAVAALCMRALLRLPGTAHSAVRRCTATGLVTAGIAAVAFQPSVAPRVIAPGWSIATTQFERARATHDASRRFARQLRTSGHEAHARALPRLAGVDVIVGFIESYGESALSDPRYAPTIRPELDRGAAALAEAGLHVASGRVEAPSQGGQSWLGHGSFLSGQWLDNQYRYDLMVTSEHATLIDDLEASGHTSIGVMPAIRRPWPEGRALGYDRVLDANSIDYAGPPLNWVTMPDQYTWKVVERARSSQRRPVFIEAALISSHAPWVPVLPVLDWERIGDGRVFRQWADAGDRPAVVWRDDERVRRHFARSLAYAVRVAGEYAARNVDDRTLLILLGDHQPAPLITGGNAPRNVPVHVISGDPALVQPFRVRGFTAGMVPPDDGPSPRMAVLRRWLHAAFGQDAHIARREDRPTRAPR